jgi:tuftelin-interacting protein 11
MDEDDEMEDERPRLGGIGSKAKSMDNTTNEMPMPSFSKGGIGSSKGGIGSSKGGIGSGKGGIGSSKGGIGSSKEGIGSTSNTSSKGDIGSSQPSAATPVDTSDLPTSFGMSRPQRSFVRDESGRAVPPRAAPMLPAEERLHFSKLEGSYGARLLAKMGWQTGTALGLDDNNIVIPLQPKLRPKGAGLAYRGFKEKSEQSKAEARRRGEIVSSDEDEKAKKRGKGKGKKAEGTTREEREEVWKKPKKSKMKVKHKTYEEIVAEAGEEAQPAGIGKIIDATGATVSTQNCDAKKAS